MRLADRIRKDEQRIDGENDMNSFARPTEERLYEERKKVAGSCPSCGGAEIAAYRVLTEGGWWDVVKCQSCLHSLDRKRSENQYAPCTLLWDLM
jgi:hypothetical protein